MGTIILSIPHKCPLCKKEHRKLTHYNSRVGEFQYLEPGDIILMNEDKKLSFIVAEGYCEKETSFYLCRVGVSNSRITSIIQPCKAH
ncbi:MAG: hypothetical protein FHOMOCKG_00014 [Methanophagales virus GBV302]|uniref:Uncharacterized protein n=1 Tax=Methanophagales virus GBV302 TaxID=2999281 RepID=A0A9E8V828_9CAUD|nr:MAG: hypothetical protein QIT37_gp014 [Methanophagales virus GBV302]WAE39542.1 MAG: hypothetical protein FHOMOCKG_00014 [Methanophagales virus GBV302]